MTPHRRPGYNKVQSLTALAHQGRHGYSGTITQTHKQMDSLSRKQTVSLTDKFKISRQTEKSSSFDWMRMAVCVGYVSHAFKTLNGSDTCTITECLAHCFCLQLYLSIWNSQAEFATNHPKCKELSWGEVSISRTASTQKKHVAWSGRTFMQKLPINQWDFYCSEGI